MIKLKFLIVTLICSLFLNCQPQKSHIDRQALVQRHAPHVNSIDSLSPFTVGNGEFAFTADVTGLQSLPDSYIKDMPTITQSQWGWHTIPNVENYRVEQTWEYVDTYGREVPYAAIMTSPAATYLRSNPQRLHLGQIGFKMKDGQALRAEDISDIDQELDLWQGIINSSFRINSQSVTVQTCAHPEIDQIAARIQSAELQQAGLAIGFDFPSGAEVWGKTGFDWQSPDKHTSKIIKQSDNAVTIERKLDSTIYFVTVQWEGAAQFIKVKDHSFLLDIQEKTDFAFSCSFSQTIESIPAGPMETFTASTSFWPDFWQSGGAVDLSKSSDPRASELERRIVLSQYLTAIQCSGSLPPQETGLTVNSWYGKFHLEMHWWHATHFVLWGRPALLEKSLPWYDDILPSARNKAELQGYEGVRWPKMTDPSGFSSPSGVGEFLIWQQPHPIYFAELLYRYYKSDDILQRYKNLVFQSADFMASFAVWDEETERYVLGPPLIPAQEVYPPTETYNSTFELSYWAFGLKTAQQWRERLGLERVEKWDHVIQHLSALPTNNGFYQNAENALDTFENEFNRNDHPTVLGAYGMLPNDHVDVDMMRKTLEQVMVSWNWQRTWGWDYPLVAMTATRVGRPDIALDALLMDVPKNTYLNNGHNWQSDRLPLYLPGNGGLLTAIAMMTAAWDGAPHIHAPGFPQDGRWIVQFENIEKMP